MADALHDGGAERGLVEVMSDQPADPKPATGPRHCWHRSPVQHTIKLHADIRCCHCGEDRCVRLKMVPPQGHGQHTPREDWRQVPEELISATGCKSAA